MSLLAGILIGFGFVLVLFTSQELMESIINWHKERRFNKLKNGVPKRVVQLRNFTDLRKYKDFPLYINGEVFTHVNNAWWGYAITYMRYFNTNGSLYITDKVIPTYKDIRGIQRYRKLLGVSDNSCKFGRVTVVSAIVEVY